MADLVSYGNADRDIEQDESSLIWISSAGEKSLKLALVSRIIPGQRTAVFRRYLRPEKDYLSFSLIYNNGKRSLDLICEDKVEAEVWITGLKALISSGQGGRSKIDGWSDGDLYFDDNKKLVSTSKSDSSVSATQDISSLEVSVSPDTNTSPKGFCPENSVYFGRSHVPSDQGNMQVKGSGSDVFRVSVSSAPSTSSHGSAPDDCDALGDVYIWGEVICDNPLKVGTDTPAHCFGKRADVLLPRPLESNVVLDVHHIACGVKHAALVTRHGEVFTWGEESGGRLGHGFGEDVTQPRLVEFLSFSAVDIVACGEFHTCAVTMAGELYTWGDGTHNAGLLGHGTDVSHWIPKRISGSLEGLQVAMVTCGPWHTALVTSTGQLFTFGDGTFGVLGHGDRENISYPREVESLSGLRTIAVACGVWHTAAVVEVIVTQSIASVSSGKLFTWGDGDKNRLGHGDKEPRLKPTCVPALIDYNFHKIACGHSLTVGLTTSGHVFTMGSTVYGQLGNPQSDGKVPCLVKDKLVAESIEEIACGAYHVAALTTRNEVYTWGKGANGRLGHGDIEDRKTPTLVEALKDRHVKFIACGSNYTAAICLHKWVSGAEQSQCSTCRQAFGFTRKRHNCYNCGLVHCHSCSSRKALRAALAPNPNKPYRVCDSCFAKLSKVAEAAANNRRNAMPRLSGENKYRLDKAEIRLPRSAMPSNVDLIKQLDNKATKQGRKADAFSFGRPYQALPLLQLKDAVMSTAVDLRRPVPKPVLASSAVSSRSVSPFSRRPSPPRSATPVPTTTGLSFSKSITDSLKKTNELLNQEVRRLRLQVESLQNRCQLQDLELKQSTKKAQEAITLAADEATKCKAAKDVIKSLTAQLKDISERLPSGAYNADNIRGICQANGLEPNGVQQPDANGEHCSDSINSSCLVSSMGAAFPATLNGLSPGEFSRHSLADSETSTQDGNQGHLNSSRREEHPDVRLPNGSLGGIVSEVAPNSTGSGLMGDDNASTRSSNLALTGNINHVEAEWIEQYEPGVYITLVALKDGTRDLKRVRFSRRRFGEHQAETWWSENREKVYEKYNVRGSSDKSSVSGRPTRRSGGGVSPSSQL
ncbi:PH, RCC1 and FYVE domains-containing protein 1-like isoform X3 [Diospyros lotus]|uniref:PH, RCC1 and FYVE domains-containing protein 1-like isoform X3 n=1 Tax=Diospyros lotus TaxID=55363 RepID=UPI002250357E|nr:PH, RCC1 and FYVE domains-containing protein 1-like isoform X3 [Diospyros lotus]